MSNIKKLIIEYDTDYISSEELESRIMVILEQSITNKLSLKSDSDEGDSCDDDLTGETE